MDVSQAIYGRRATRSYTSEPLGEEIIKQLIDAAIHAPSAVNEQPWAFVVVEDPEIMRTISDASKQLMHKDAAWQKMEAGFRSILESPAFNIFYHAPALIILCRKPQGAHPDWDCCFAAENLMLRATELGLGSCVIGFSWEALKDPEIKKMLKIPDEYEGMLPIIVGHPSEHPAATPRNAPEVLNWIHAKSPVSASG